MHCTLWRNFGNKMAAPMVLHPQCLLSSISRPYSEPLEPQRRLKLEGSGRSGSWQWLNGAVTSSRARSCGAKPRLPIYLTKGSEILWNMYKWGKWLTDLRCAGACKRYLNAAKNKGKGLLFNGNKCRASSKCSRFALLRFVISMEVSTPQGSICSRKCLTC